MVFIAAVRLQRPKDRALLRLAQLRTEGVRKRNQGDGFPTHRAGDPPVELTYQEKEAFVESWIEDFRNWTQEVHDEVEKLSPVQAEWWTTLGDVPQTTQRRHLLNDAHVFNMNMFNERLHRLELLLERLGDGPPVRSA